MRKYLLLILSVLIISCSSDDDTSIISETSNYKKIKTIVSENSTSTYIYNAKGFVIEMNYDGDISFNTKFIYQGDRIVQREISYSPEIITIEKYYYEGDYIVKSETEHSYIEYFYNEKGQMIKAISIHPYSPALDEEITYSYYQNGNLFSITSSSGFYETYDYDDKINPQYYTVPDSYIKISRTTKNNFTRIGDFHYSYEYDSDGYPIIEYSSNKTFIYTYY